MSSSEIVNRFLYASRDLFDEGHHSFSFKQKLSGSNPTSSVKSQSTSLLRCGRKVNKLCALVPFLEIITLLKAKKKKQHHTRISSTERGEVKFPSFEIWISTRGGENRRYAVDQAVRNLLRSRHHAPQVSASLKNV